MTTPIPPNGDGEWHFSHPSDIWGHIAIAMIKEWPRFEQTSRLLFPPGPIYVHLGNGNKFIDDPEWVHLDMPAWNAMVDELPFSDNSVDGIATYHMLDHLPDPRPLMREVERVLKDDAWFVNIVPHYSSELANADVDHKTRFAVDTWKNMFATTHYDNQGEWQLRVGFNMIMAFTERNTVLVTQLLRKPRT